MDFIEFEKQLNHLFQSEGVFSYFGSKFNAIDYKDIHNEVNIQENLIDFDEQNISNNILVYASERLEECALSKTKARYYLFLIKNSKKKIWLCKVIC
ncbi:hypothetical protein BKP45_21035 [Anaerobacillus alkalidiazotrophicus]|uniref:Uncharacterized protein n=1 Tax=Anaerobacillus alkalidiazotrophicus TaxID=472963 RepID=A0A1S2LVZ9_9BACI|nr:hypothetical protein [Anaerobacillus alkalidiazotrophicus]OIJ16494.1 hypothetical protein BKP45_21035 [Anaerobacillus alkalidiazotrophicus]